jgi:hypothetical protein
MNLVVTESGRVFRIDLELAGELTGSRGRLLVPMIRRLVETHVIACGDAAERARAFQRRIERDILLPAGVTYAATEPGVAASSRGSGLLTSRQAG